MWLIVTLTAAVAISFVFVAAFAALAMAGAQSRLEEMGSDRFVPRPLA